MNIFPILPLIKFLRKFNLEVIDILEKDIHGGSIRIFISGKGNYKKKKSVNKICKTEIKANLNSKEILQDFKKKVAKNRLDLISLLIRLKKANKNIVALSAPAKGMTLLNYNKLDSDFLD